MSDTQPRPVGPDGERPAGDRARAGRDTDSDGASVILETGAGRLAARHRLDERLQLRDVRVREELAVILREPRRVRTSRQLGRRR